MTRHVEREKERTDGPTRTDAETRGCVKARSATGGRNHRKREDTREDCPQELQREHGSANGPDFRLPASRTVRSWRWLQATLSGTFSRQPQGTRTERPGRREEAGRQGKEDGTRAWQLSSWVSPNSASFPPHFYGSALSYCPSLSFQTTLALPCPQEPCICCSLCLITSTPAFS